MVQWLRFYAPNAGGTGSVPSQGTKIPHVMWLRQKKSKEKSIPHKDINKMP